MTALLLLALMLAQNDTLRVDGFEDPSRWTAHPADGVRLTLAGDSGRRGRALRMDFAFSGGGYAIARRPLDLPLPENYVLTLWVRGRLAPNTFEFKLVDSTGENVWWYTERDRAFTGSWERITIRKRQVSFAWGPRGGGELGRAAALELVITAGKGGGSGSVWFDELTLTSRPADVPYTGRPTAGASEGSTPKAAVDGDTLSAWRAPVGRPTLTVDFGQLREFGGVSLVWQPGRAALDYRIDLSNDGRTWSALARMRGGNGGRDHHFLPDREARYLRLSLERAESGDGFALAEVVVRPLEFSASRNAFFETVARESPAGAFPRYYSGRRSYWTVIGVDQAEQEALFNEDGDVDAGVGAFSVEPFLRLEDRLFDWHNVEHRVGLVEDDLPMPWVEWTAGSLRLRITGFGVGPAEHSSVIMRYRLQNTGSAALNPTLQLAVRPFQVNPPWQFLGAPGGAARIDSVRWNGVELRINRDRRVFPLVKPTRVAAAAYSGGEIVEHLRAGRLPGPMAAADSFGAASAVLSYSLALAAGESTEVAIQIPLSAVSSGQRRLAGTMEAAERATARRWREILSRSRIELPDWGADVARTIRSTIAWILINRDRAAIQPGSRSYERSWIRDGSLTSAALLRFGHAEPVREFIDWYAGFLYPNGKVPCCVDRRGADPVPEHDSHGEFIYLVMEYWRHTGDRALLERLWPRVLGAVNYMDSLRQSLRTPEYRRPDRQVFFGLLPPSISHEGYSAKPMHSYWDDFFALRGFKDAAVMAQVLGRSDEAGRIAAIRDEFRADVLASLERAMAQHRIPFLPGAADLGDFDATSTTIAVSPGGELARLPRAALDSTFERYWNQVSVRRDSSARWEAYTPYELRTVGTMLRLGRKDRALQLLRMFLGDREPPQWNQWPEVVWRDRRAGKFIGDSPHTWVGSDFLRSAADLFVYERESDSALVIGAGIPDAWLGGSGLTVERLHTWWGPLSYRARLDGDTVRLRFEPGLKVPPGGLVIHTPGDRPARAVRVDDRQVPLQPGDPLVLRTAPVDLVFLR